MEEEGENDHTTRPQTMSRASVGTGAGVGWLRGASSGPQGGRVGHTLTRTTRSLACMPCTHCCHPTDAPTFTTLCTQLP